MTQIIQFAERVPPETARTLLDSLSLRANAMAKATKIMAGDPFSCDRGRSPQWLKMLDGEGALVLANLASDVAETWADAARRIGWLRIECGNVATPNEAAAEASAIMAETFARTEALERDAHAKLKPLLAAIIADGLKAAMS